MLNIPDANNSVLDIISYIACTSAQYTHISALGDVIVRNNQLGPQTPYLYFWYRTDAGFHRYSNTNPGLSRCHLFL